MGSLAIVNIGQLTTNDPGEGDGPTGLRHAAGLVLDSGKVAWIGASSATPAADAVLDAGGGAVLPGFVDSHTHLVFAGDRVDEFEARMAGEPYTGGGILRTVASTRAAPRSDLEARARSLAGQMLASGTTTIEVKSGYELTVEGERRLLEIASDVTEEVTYLGAHTVPPEFEGRREEYVALVAGDMLDHCAPIARWGDVFCERGAFSVDEAREILLACQARGLGLRVHGNQLGSTGGVALAASLGAASVDHCTHCSEDDVALLEGSGTVAVLLPAAEFCTRGPYPDARRLLDAGVAVALATDCNPGTAYVTSMPFVIALAVREMGMTCDEAVLAATRGGASALQRHDIGHLAVGARGDLVVLDAPSTAHIAYRPGSALARQVVRAGVPSVS